MWNVLRSPLHRRSLGLRYIRFWGFGSDKEKEVKKRAVEDPGQSSVEPSLLRDQLDQIKARGFLKYRRRYNPPENVDLIIIETARELNLNTDDSTQLEPRSKFELLSALEEKLHHRVPSFMLAELTTIQDVVEFYRQPVSNVTNYAELARSASRPRNLHIIEDPVRFNPDTDTQFGGVTAFPKSSTVMQSLRASRLYPGYRAKTEWHHFQEKNFCYTEPPPNAPWVDTQIVPTITGKHSSQQFSTKFKN